MVIHNRTKLIEGLTYKTRDIRDVSKVIMHRIMYPGAQTTEDIFREEKNNEEVWKALGGKFPYHFVIEPTGKVCQVVPLSYIAPHARKYNASSVAVALIGDFRNHEPTPEAFTSAVWLVGALRWSESFWNDVTVHGHSDLPESSNYPNHSCPGRGFDMEVFETFTDALPLHTLGITA